MMNQLFPPNDTGEKMTICEFIDNSINSAVVERHTHMCSPDLEFLIFVSVSDHLSSFSWLVHMRLSGKGGSILGVSFLVRT